jgi:ferritin-like metal-binding protein YciE
MRFETLNDVLMDQLGDLRSAEQQIVQALPKVAAAASDDDLRQALQMHLEQTREHLRRLDRLETLVPMAIPQQHCEGMEGLLREGEEVVQADGRGPAKDAALIAAAQRVEHYEIAGYGTARTLADELDLDEARDLLDLTLDEEKDADAKLNKVATGGLFGRGVNQEAKA